MPTLEKKFAKEKDACFIFSIGKNKLHEMVDGGYVRFNGGGRPGSDRRYCCEDIEQYLLREAAGRPQRIMRGRIK
jgi:hypothetical protein